MSRPVAKHIIVGIHVTERVKQAGEVQRVLTGYGANIKTRVGLHDASAGASKSSGVILLEMVGAEAKCLGILKKLNAIQGVEAQKFVFGH
ncbi:MAG: hypothetical protein BWZ02_02628 [Lentisphaerae bacterium ADurb.BinA184]|nr:MAG: hypothetical protein BWZ02_02628 [Lentisphaerae bacterium ADurb.BinA184]